jgi:RING-type zinc-finger
MNADDEDWQKICPICFADDFVLAKVSNCGHTFCIECLQRLFCRYERQVDTELASVLPGNNSIDNFAAYNISTTEQLLRDLMHFNIDNIPTIERCPCCRSPISMLAVVQLGTESLVFNDKCITRLEKTPLFGKVFATSKGVGQNSFHFTSKSSTAEEVEAMQNGPYILRNPYSNSKSSNCEFKKYFFDDGCFYFSPKRTFHGTVSLPNENEQLQRCSIILCFSPDHLSITGGIMIRPALINPACSQSTDSKNKVDFPLDGTWKVIWFTERIPNNIDLDAMDCAIMHVTGNVIRLAVGGPEYKIQYENDRIFFEWPDCGVVQTSLEPECDFRSGTGDVPAVGSILRWKTADLLTPYIAWVRVTIEEFVGDTLPTIEYFGRSGGDRSLLRGNIISRRSLSWYRSIYNDGENDRIKYFTDNLWGNTFCQGLHVGLASYHFCQIENPTQEQHPNYAYISYESEACQQWPPLDDGSPIPSRVPFRNIVIDQVVKNLSTVSLEGTNVNTTVEVTFVVFRGTIEWLQDYGTTWQGNQRWEYEMIFDTQFTCILSGTVHSITQSGSREEMSQYGSALVYVNAGILSANEQLDNILTVSAANAGTNDNTPLSVLTRAVQSRLIWEGVTRRTNAMVGMALSRAYGTNE